MRTPLLVVAALAITLTSALAASGEPPAGGEAATAPDACALLSDAEIAAVQGSAVAARTPSAAATGGLEILRCVYRTADFARSVSLEVTQPAPGTPAGSGRARFEARFGDALGEPESEREEERARIAPGEGDTHGPAPKPGELADAAPENPDGEGEAAPERVDGLGDEAFWIGTPVYGALHVRLGDVALRVSPGGPGDREAKLAAARRLATAALARLAPPPSR